METRQVIFGDEAKSKLEKGVETLSSAVKVTLGAMGRNVVIAKPGLLPHVTKDGVTVARYVRPSDPIEAIGADIVREAAINTSKIAGDGTTTSTILAEALIKGGLSAIAQGENSVNLVLEMNEVVKRLISQIGETAKPIEHHEQLLQVATISANNDKFLGKIISDVIAATGKYGNIRVENSPTSETYTKVEKGFVLDTGYLSPYFCNNPLTMEAVYQNAFVMVCDMELTNLTNDFFRALENLVEGGNLKAPVIIIAKEINGEMLSGLVLNKVQSKMPIVAIKVPNVGDVQTSILNDISIATGATVISEELGLPFSKVKLEHFGGCEKIVVNKDKTVMFSPKGSKQAIEERVVSIENEIKENQNDRQVSILKNRIANLRDGIGVIYAGAITEVELKEKKDRIDDAVCATRSAQEEGIVSGGGVTLYKASLGLGNTPAELIVKKAIQQPLIQILLNAGIVHTDDIEILVSQGKGIDVKTRKEVDMIEAGIIDPYKVTRVSLENAISVASQLLLCEAVSYEGGQKND